jgi:hypothetical protein
LLFETPADAAAPSPENCIRADFPVSASSSHVAVGRGGFSLNVDQRDFRDTIIGFSLTFANGPLTRLYGWGALRRCENAPQGSRIGIEFIHLDAESLAQLSSWLQHFALVSFIPKDCHSHSVTSSTL